MKLILFLCLEWQIGIFREIVIFTFTFRYQNVLELQNGSWEWDSHMCATGKSSRTDCISRKADLINSFVLPHRQFTEFIEKSKLAFLFPNKRNWFWTICGHTRIFIWFWLLFFCLLIHYRKASKPLPSVLYSVTQEWQNKSLSVEAAWSASSAPLWGTCQQTSICQVICLNRAEAAVVAFTGHFSEQRNLSLLSV